MYTNPVRVYMTKLYWRIKINGKWTWKAAECGFCETKNHNTWCCNECCYINKFEEEEKK